MKFLLLSTCFLFANIKSAAAHVKNKWQSPTTTEHRVAVTVDQLIGDRQQSDSFDAVAVSPQCWHSAILLIQKAEQDINADSAAALCASLPEAHQKRLALEIADCHMQDLGEPLYQNSAIQQLCTTVTIDSVMVQKCLKHLTDAGKNSYTHYITYVQILCTRKTQELFLQYQREVKDDISMKYAEISGQSIRHLEAHTETLAKIPSLVKDQLINELKDQLKETLQHTLDEQLKERLNDVLKSQATEQASFFTNIMEQMQQRDEEHKDRYDDFTSYQSSMLLQQTREMERQRKAVEEHRAKVQILSETVSETTLNMQPLFGLQSLVKVATEGYTWITFLLHFLGTFNIVWIITRPERCLPFRSYLYGLVLAEALLELALTGAVRYNLLSESDRTLCIFELRQWAIFVECACYVFGMIASCFYSDPSKGGAGNVLTSTRQDLERLVDERLGLAQRSERLIVEASYRSQDVTARSPQLLEPKLQERRVPYHQDTPEAIERPNEARDHRTDTYARQSWTSPQHDGGAVYIDPPYGYRESNANHRSNQYQAAPAPDPRRQLESAAAYQHDPYYRLPPPPPPPRVTPPLNLQSPYYETAYGHPGRYYQQVVQHQQYPAIAIDFPPPQETQNTLGMNSMMPLPVMPNESHPREFQQQKPAPEAHLPTASKRPAVTPPIEEPSPKRAVVAVAAAP